MLNHLLRMTSALAVVMLFTVVVLGCGDSEVGDNLENAADATQNAVEDAADATQDAADDAVDATQDAADDTADAAEDAVN